MRRALVLLFTVAATIATVMGTATAADTRPVLSSGPGAQALSCQSGWLCVWPVADGSSSLCTWGIDDPDWQSGTAICSWSDSKPVKAIYNHGTSTGYSGVCLYANANYTNPKVYLAQGYATTSSSVYLRSHRWVSSYSVCFP